MQVKALCVRAAAFTCAVPLSQAVETMRPLPVQAVRGAPDFVRGLTRMRGHACPVIDLAALLCAPHERPAGRFVGLHVGAIRLALAVDEVLGANAIDAALMRKLPSILGEMSRGAVEASGVLGQDLLLALDATKLLPDETWRTLAGVGTSR